MPRPNILFIMSDNQAADTLGCYGNGEAHTPHLDSLAQHGVRFENAFCVNAMCSPCRASVLTGLMPSQHGVHNWLDDQMMDRWPKTWSAIEEFANLPTMMKHAGYSTALIGKFHLGVPFKPQLAFDHWVTFPHGHTTSFYGNEVIDNAEQYRCEGHTVEFFTDKTIAFLEHQAHRPEPFFAFVPFNGPYGHWPAIAGRADPEFAEFYYNADLSSIPREGLADDVLKRFATRVAKGGLREQFKGPLLLPNNLDALRNYFAQISLVDHSVGRIVSALERLNLRDDTIIVYTSDHGFSLGHHGIWGHGAAAFPASAHRPSYQIPLIFSGPSLRAGHVDQGMTSQIDLFPTLASLAGLENSAPSLPSSARDLTPRLQGDTGMAPDAIFYEQEETRAIRTKDWLFAARFQGAAAFPMQDALYDLRKDPSEKQNLIGRSELEHVVQTLRTQLTGHFEEYSTPRYDLWNGGTAKSNVTDPALWQNAWGPAWHPEMAV